MGSAGLPNTDRGGGMFNFVGGPVVANVTFAGNMARLGGGIVTLSANGMALSGVTFTATGEGDPIHMRPWWRAVRVGATHSGKSR